MAYCEECGGLGEVCDDCVVGPLRDKIAALEAERNELAARLRAASCVIQDATEGNAMPTQADLDALDGPVPECRACAETRAIALEILDIFTQERAIPHKVADKIDAMHRIEDRARRVLARHAADEGGGHE